MHYFQQRYLRENRAFVGLTGMLTIELPNKGLLSGIELRVSGICGINVAKPDVWLHDRLKKIEVIVNGSQVVKSLTGTQLKAMMLYKRTPWLSHDEKNMSGASCKEYFYINLGRWFHDLEYMLDLSQVNDPELRIEYDFTLASANGWTNGVAMTASPKYWIICHLLRDTSIVPKGYIKSSEIHRFTHVGAANHNMTVPRGPTYSNLYLDSWWKLNGVGAVVDHIDVNINSDDLIPIRITPEDWTATLKRLYGAMQSHQQTQYTHGQQYPFPLEESIFQGGGPMLDGVEMMYMDIWGNFAGVGFRDCATGLTPTAGSYNRNVYLKGVAPFSVWAIPLFEPWDPETWIDTSVLGDFWVRVEENATRTAGPMILLGDEVVTKYTTPSWP